MARPRAFDEQEVLERAMHAFWRHGYLGTGIQELVEATGINRASLYGTFGNKQRLFLSALERYSEICIASLREALHSVAHPIVGIRRMLDAFKDDILSTARGCMLYNTALEVSCYDEDIRSRVERAMNEIERMLVQHIAQAQAGGVVDPHADALVLARVVMSAMQSMTVRGSAGGSAPLLDSIRDGALLVFREQPVN